MKISMWNILSRLNYDNIVSMIKEGSETIETVRWIVYSFLNEKTVYVGEASVFFYGNHDGTVIVHRNDMLLIPDSDPEEVFNEVCAILDHFREWEKTLEILLESENGLTKMLDCSDSIFENPMFIYAPDGKSLATSSHYPPEINWHWAEILKNNGLSEERMKTLRDQSNLTRVFKDLTPTFHESKIGLTDYIHCSILANHYMAGHFVLFSMHKPLSQEVLPLCRILVSYISKYMERYYAKYSSTSRLGEIASSILNSNTYDENELALFLSTLKWDALDTYKIFAIQENVPQEPVMLNRMYIRLAETFVDSIVFCHKKQLLILTNCTRNKKTLDYKEHLAPFIADNYICGISQTFYGIKQCREYYEQACNELKRCIMEKNCYSDAETCGYDYISQLHRCNPLSRTYVHRGLLKLYDYDLKHKTPYYATLRAYVFSGFQPSLTGVMLHTHRNSVNYRLEKIKQLIDFQEFYDLMQTMDINKLHFLHFSFAYIDSMSPAPASERSGKK